MNDRARRPLALAVSIAGAGIVALDGTVLAVAQPDLRRDLHAGLAEVQWTSTGYLVAVAALLVLAGRLGDRYGHTRLLAVGLVGFAGASAGIVVAPGIGWVIALRVLQGVSGALLQPATLAILRLAYPADKLGGPVAIRTSAIGVAAAAGPLLGGALVGAFGWRAVFVINVPVALAAAVATRAVRLPVPDRAAASRPDLVAAVLLAAALAVGVHGLAGVPAHGWTGAPTLLGLGAAAVLAILLVAYEWRSRDPVVPRVVARSVPVTAAMALLLVVSAGMFGALFTATFLLQDTLRLGPLAAGLRVLPLTALMVVGAPVAGIALRRFGPRRTALTGVALVAAGIAGMYRLDAGWPATLGASALLGAGFAAVMVTGTGTVVGDAPPGHAGVVGGLKQTAMNVGPTLGIAVAAGTAPAGRSATASTLLVLAGLAAVALLPAWFLPDRTRRAAPHPTADPEPAAGRVG